jgi:uncharacterized phiE125 gp8 family phage protein
MSLILLTPPAIEPVSIAEAKTAARITINGPTPVAISTIARASGVVTAAATAHGLVPGQLAIVAAVLDPSFDIVVPVSSVPDANHLIWAQPGVDASSSGGTVGAAGSEDQTVSDLITAAREDVEDFTRTALITQSWQYLRDGFPGYHPLYDRRGYPQFYLPKPPLQAVTLFQYVDTGGVTQTLATAPDDYQLDPGDGSRPARLLPPFARPWPPARLIPSNVTVEFTCGYGDTADTVPMKIRLAIRKTVADWYMNRERVGVVPGEARDILADYRNLVG